VAGNWKMNGCDANLSEIVAIRDHVASGAAGTAEVVLCPPVTLLTVAAELCADSDLLLGGQDCHAAPSGAHTGDIAAEMLKDAGATYVIVGHSERRADHAETDAIVRAKAAAGMRAGLSVILCVGESRAEHEAGEAFVKVGAQLAESLPEAVNPGQLVVAYEPVWAIGTGVTPTPAHVGAMHRFLRDELRRHVAGAADQIRILYGGSVKPGNAAELLSIPDVDGTLVGGASLKADEFLPIMQVYASPAPA